MNEKPKFEDSLKSIETENFFDRTFYRQIGYRIALLLKNTGITPNQITIVSIFVGVFAGILFYPENLLLNLFGILLLIFANILDCVDGQLARLTGIKSQVGRILDGLAGDLWFVAIYIAIAMRLEHYISPAWAWTLVSLAGASNLVQANITDYYKTLHLYFISLKKGAEFDTVERVKVKYAQMPRGINKVLSWLYIYYTILQSKITPQLQKMLSRLIEKYGEDFPEDVRLRLREKNLKIIPIINRTTFNGRSIVLFLSLIISSFWSPALIIYLLYEIIFLNFCLILAKIIHENMCKKFTV
ncbi:MAG: CDP-alcohol phosphatidyltransferase family protein [Prevotellaceae bacterium]|nr:CDP-alcohol phosphatidyltransferase family protein [Prevotellaceae bacterium]